MNQLPKKVKYTIRQADENDVYNISVLHDKIFQEDAFYDVLNHIAFTIYELPDYNYVAVDDNNKIIGFLTSGWHPLDNGPKEILDYIKKQDTDVLIITTLAVVEEYRGNGIGKHLLVNMLDDIKNIKQIMLQVRKSNNIAIKLYEKNGFKIISSIPNYYNKPVEDGWLMINIVG